MDSSCLSDLELYLYMGFVPRFAEASLEWFLPENEEEFKAESEEESWWISEGVKVFKNVMADEITKIENGVTHVIPLSAGLDSRLILGSLMDNLPASQIVATTYGIPGSWDLDVAKAISRRFRLQHQVFDLTDDRWDIEELIKAAKRLPRPVNVYQCYVRQKITNYFGNECVYWSGFLGDAVTWAELKTPNTDKRKAVEYALKPQITKNFKDQEFYEQLMRRAVLECPWERLAHPKYTLDMQLEFGIRQQQLTRYIALVHGFSFITPFLNKRWVIFSSNIPYKWLFDRQLHRKIICAGYPELAKFPTTASVGMRVNASSAEIYLGKVIAKIQPYIVRRDRYFSHPRTNYINWTEALRHKTPLQNTVYITLQDLKQRAILDNKSIDAWWSDHLNRKKDYTTLLMNLSSLELLLKVGVMQAGRPVIEHHPVIGLN